MKLLSRVQLFATPWTVDHQAPLSIGFSRQEYWSGLPCPSPGDLRDPGTEPASLMSPALAGGFFTTIATWEAPKEGTSFSYVHESLLVVLYTLLYLICMNVAKGGVMNVKRGKISMYPVL